MNTRQRIRFGIFLFLALATNYEAQISHLTNDQIAHWTLHDWVGALLNVAIAVGLAAKAYLDDSTPPSVSKP